MKMPDARKPSEAEKQFRHRRARKRRKLSQPPKESEVRAFLNRLGRTSFKRRSKGFKQFMWDLGIDLEADAPESPGNGGDEDRGGDDDGATEDEDDEEGEA